MKNVMLFAAVSFLFALTSCQKEDAKPSNLELITEPAWKIVGMTIQDLDEQEWEIIGSIEPCELDDLHYFKNNGTFVINQNELKCDDDEAEEEIAGSWSFGANDDQLLLAVDGETKSCKILELSEEKLKIQFKEETDIDLLTTYTVTFRSNP